MNSDERSIFSGSLTGASAVAWNLGRLVVAHHPGKEVLHGVTDPFDLEEFAGQGKCKATLSSSEHASIRTSWSRAHGLHESSLNAVYDVIWKEHALRVVVATWREGAYERVSTSTVIADSIETARAFAEEVCAFCNDPGRTILRFTAGCWSKSHELWKNVQAASFDDLILAGDLKAQIQGDFSAFLGAKSEYARFGVAYKRGALFLGPPGNGKTHCLRALIKFLGVPCLFVQSFKSRYGEEDSHIADVFDRAKEITPCCLVFEDLDAMVHDDNRAFFLNQLDGLGNASGLLTIATTNHADRLDPAIIDRPSRFDRKYHFDLPAPKERLAYLSAWNTRHDPDLRVTADDLARLVESTDEFSFAYLKELCLSSMMRWMVDRKSGGMANELAAQVAVLRAQMKTGSAAQTTGASSARNPSLAKFKKLLRR